jgi:hypothetical protein
LGAWADFGEIRLLLRRKGKGTASSAKQKADQKCPETPKNP